MRNRIIFYFVLVILISCSKKADRLEIQIYDYYKNNYLTAQSQSSFLKNITWFNWDKVIFLENEEGRVIQFYYNNKIVYKYCKYYNFDKPDGIQFGAFTYDSIYNNNIRITLLIDTTKLVEESAIYIEPYTNNGF